MKGGLSGFSQSRKIALSLCGPLRVSATSAFNELFNTKHAERRSEPQRLDNPATRP